MAEKVIPNFPLMRYFLGTCQCQTHWGPVEASTKWQALLSYFRCGCWSRPCQCSARSPWICVCVCDLRFRVLFLSSSQHLDSLWSSALRLPEPTLWFSWTSPLGMTERCGHVKASSLACGWDNSEVELIHLRSILGSGWSRALAWDVPLLVPPSQVFPGSTSITCHLLKNPRLGLCFSGSI